MMKIELEVYQYHELSDEARSHVNASFYEEPLEGYFEYCKNHKCLFTRHGKKIPQIFFM